jgi:hypothetical protein
MALLLGAAVLAVSAAATAYSVGVFDEVVFKEQTRLTQNAPGSLQFMAIIATCTSKDGLGQMDSISADALKGIMAMKNGAEMLRLAAKMYGTPEGCNRCRVAIYIDDPQTTTHPRWAVGWVVAASTLREIQKITHDIQEASGLDGNTFPVRAVRLEGPKSLKATVPFRNKLTPTIAAYLHWSAAFEKYTALGCTANCGRASEQDGSVAMEIFVTKEETMAWIDYILLYGNTSTLWDDAFPEIAQESSTESERRSSSS